MKDLKTMTNEIVFNTKGSVTTKAIVEGTTMVDNFGVYGYVVPGSYSDGGYIMKNAEYNPEGNAVNGPYYWPKSDNNQGIDFIFTAYSQFNGSPVWENDVLKLTIPKLSQNLIDNPDDFNDVLWAQTSVNHHQDGNVNATHERVNLNFKHALSWLQFKGEVTNPNVKWAKVKQIIFGEYVDAIPATPEQQIAKPQNGLLTGTSWARTSTAVGAVITQEDIDYINGLFTYTGGLTFTYGDSAALTTTDNVNGYFNEALGIKDYLISKHPSLAGVSDTFMNQFNNFYLIHIEKKDNEVCGWFYNKKKGQVSSVSTVEYETIPGSPAIPAHSSEGLYIDGVLSLPTASLITVSPVVTITDGAQKDTVINYLSAQAETINTNDHKILGNALVIPQLVPEKITVVFDICIVNPTGDEIVFTDRKITRVINAGNDMKDVAYVSSWLASNKYIYNFKFDGDIVDFTINVDDWTTNSTNEYHVWDY